MQVNQFTSDDHREYCERKCREFVGLSLTARSTPEDIAAVLGVPTVVVSEWEHDMQTSGARGWSALVDQTFPEDFEAECDKFVQAVKMLDQARGISEVADPDRVGRLLVQAFIRMEHDRGLDAVCRLMGWLAAGTSQPDYAMR